MRRIGLLPLGHQLPRFESRLQAGQSTSVRRPPRPWRPLCSSALSRTEFSSIELVSLGIFFLNSFLTSFRTVVLEFKLNQKDLTLVGNNYKINAWSCLPPRLTVGLNGSPSTGARPGEVAGPGAGFVWRGQQGLCEGQGMVDSETGKGEDVSTPVRNPPSTSRRDHGVGLPVAGPVGQESCELGQGQCQGQPAREMAIQAWATQVPTTRCPVLSLSSAQGSGGL